MLVNREDNDGMSLKKLFYIDGMYFLSNGKREKYIKEVARKGKNEKDPKENGSGKEMENFISQSYLSRAKFNRGREKIYGKTKIKIFDSQLTYQ